MLCPKLQECFPKRTREHADDMPIPQVMESYTHCSSQAISAILVGDAVLSTEMTRARSTPPAGRRVVHCSPQYEVRVVRSLRNSCACLPTTGGLLFEFGVQSPRSASGILLKTTCSSEHLAAVAGVSFGSSTGERTRRVVSRWMAPCLVPIATEECTSATSEFQCECRCASRAQKVCCAQEVMI